MAKWAKTRFARNARERKIDVDEILRQLQERPEAGKLSGKSRFDLLLAIANERRGPKPRRPGPSNQSGDGSVLALVLVSYGFPIVSVSIRLSLFCVSQWKLA